MRGLIEPELATARETDGCPKSPILLLDLCRNDAFGRQGLERGVEVVAHEIEHRAEQLVSRMTLDEALTRGMHGDLGRRQGEDQPSSAGVDTLKTQDLAQKTPIGIGILAIEQKVSAVDHRRVEGRGR